MFSTFSLPFSGWLKAGRSGALIDLPPVKVHNVGSINEPSARRILGTAYILGATPDQLSTFYEEESKNHEVWRPSPGEISNEDWRDFLGNHKYQRGFVDFFEDQLVAFGYDWKPLVEHYMYEGDQPLINSIVSGLAHPLIHLGYAYELDSQDVAIEALGLTACFYDTLHKYLDDPSYTRPASYTSTSPLAILQKVSQDARLNGICTEKGPDQHAILLASREEVLLDHWNAWSVSSDPQAQFAALQRAAVALVIATHTPGEPYDFFLLHLLTSSHAIRILLPIVPVKFQVPLVRQWFLFALLTYAGQLRPVIDERVIETVQLRGRTWKDVDYAALGAAGVRDVHFAKDTWGDEDQYFLKAAVKFADEFSGWGGYPSWYSG